MIVKFNYNNLPTYKGYTVKKNGVSLVYIGSGKWCNIADPKAPVKISYPFKADNRTSANAQVLGHLMKYGSITPIEALNKYRCLRLAARIHNLRQYGWPITTDLKKNKSGNGKHACYKLAI